MVNETPQEPKRHRLLFHVSSLAVAGTGCFALVGWAFHLPFPTSFGAGRIPMAPSTALLFVMSGISVFLHPGLPWFRGAYRVSRTLAYAGTLAAFLLFVLSILGIQPTSEHLGFTAAGTVGGAPIGHMSPITAVCFLLAGLSFLALPPSVTDRSRRAKAALYLASLLVAASLVLLLAYLFGTPMFYSGAFIPPALNTSIAFLVLGSTLLYLALPHTGLLRREEEQATRTEYVLLLCFLLLAAGIVTLGYLYQQNYERRYRKEVESRLSAVAELKVRELAQYRKERLEDAAVFFRNASFSGMVRRFLENPEDAGARRQIRAWIGNYGAQSEGDRVFLLDTRGGSRISVPETSRPPDSTLSRRAAEIVRSGQLAFQDFYRNEYNGKIFLAVLIPILDEREGVRPLGVLALRIDPEKYLFPLINYWPTPSRTAETILVRRDGNDVLVLNALSYDNNSALRMRIPLDTNSESPAVKAILGKKGVMEGRDTRGMPVLADVREIPDSPWLVVSRIALSEIYEPARERLLWMVSLVCVMLLAAGAGVGLAWRQQRARFYRQNELILSSAAEGILGLDLQGRHTFVNPAAARMLGYEVEELLGRPSHSTWHHTKPDGSPYPAEECQIYTTYRNGVVHHVSTEVFWTKGGAGFPVEYVSTPIHEQGRVAGAVLSFTDITDRNRSERALKESEEKFRVIFEGSKDGIVLTDVESRKFQTCNKAFCDMLQYAPDEIRRLGISDIHPEEYLPRVLDAFDRGVKRESEVAGGIPVRKKDGTVWWAEVTASPVTISGKQYLLGNFRDVTQLLSLEKQVRMAQKLEAVGTLAGGIAHDFNNALTGIVGFGELLRRRMAGDAEALHDLDEIQRCAERAATLTRQLLTFARRQLIEPLNMDLNSLVADLMKLIGKVVGEHIEVNTHLDKNVPTIHADRGQVEQVVMNLCLNARDAMPEGGRLVVETGGVQLEEEYVRRNPYMKKGNYAVLTVSDTGAGMDEKIRERVFEPFFTTKEPDKGTGLGLSMVYGIVKQHGGFIHLYSEPGKGTVFKVYFPAIEARPDAVSA